jgi:hypothetical protein
MELKEIMWECADWNYLAKTREHMQAVANTLIRHQVPWRAAKKKVIITEQL